MSSLKYRRVLLKISGEALAGDATRGLDFDVIGQVCDVVARCNREGVQVGIVVGGGNFWRGLKDGKGMRERTRADHMGMLATAINCLALADMLEQRGVQVRVQTAIEMRAIAEPYIRSRAIRHLEKGRVVIFGCGTGNPFFSPDTAAGLRAEEIDADVILLAKNIVGVYSADPKPAGNGLHRHIPVHGQQDPCDPLRSEGPGEHPAGGAGREDRHHCQGVKEEVEDEGRAQAI